MHLVKVLNCKLLTNGKQIPAFPQEVKAGIRTPISEVGSKCVITAQTWPLLVISKSMVIIQCVTLILLVYYK